MLLKQQFIKLSPNRLGIISQAAYTAFSVAHSAKTSLADGISYRYTFPSWTDHPAIMQCLNHRDSATCQEHRIRENNICMDVDNIGIYFFQYFFKGKKKRWIKIAVFKMIDDPVSSFECIRETLLRFVAIWLQGK